MSDCNQNTYLCQHVAVDREWIVFVGRVRQHLLVMISCSRLDDSTWLLAAAMRVSNEVLHICPSVSHVFSSKEEMLFDIKCDNGQPVPRLRFDDNIMWFHRLPQCYCATVNMQLSVCSHISEYSTWRTKIRVWQRLKQHCTFQPFPESLEAAYTFRHWAISDYVILPWVRHVKSNLVSL